MSGYLIVCFISAILISLIVLVCQIRFASNARWHSAIERDRPALVAATIAGDHAEVKRILDSGADPDVLDHIGAPETGWFHLRQWERMPKTVYGVRTPLMIASVAGNETIASELIAHGAVVGFRDVIRGNAANTALGLAVSAGHLRVVKLLLSHGADPNQMCALGSFPLVDAADVGNMEIIESLLDAGASVDIQSEDGDTALITAAWCDYVSEPVIRRLLRAGADRSIRNKEGKCAADIAADCGNVRVVSVLAESSDDSEL